MLLSFCFQGTGLQEKGKKENPKNFFVAIYLYLPLKFHFCKFRVKRMRIHKKKSCIRKEAFRIKMPEGEPSGTVVMDYGLGYGLLTPTLLDYELGTVVVYLVPLDECGIWESAIYHLTDGTDNIVTTAAVCEGVALV